MGRAGAARAGRGGPGAAAQGNAGVCVWGANPEEKTLTGAHTGTSVCGGAVKARSGEARGPSLQADGPAATHKLPSASLPPHLNPNHCHHHPFLLQSDLEVAGAALAKTTADLTHALASNKSLLAWKLGAQPKLAALQTRLSKVRERPVEGQDCPSFVPRMPCVRGRGKQGEFCYGGSLC